MSEHQLIFYGVQTHTRSRLLSINFSHVCRLFKPKAPSRTNNKKHARGEIFSKSYCIKPNPDCIYHFPMDLEPNGRPLRYRSIGKFYTQSDFGLI